MKAVLNCFRGCAILLAFFSAFILDGFAGEMTIRLSPDRSTSILPAEAEGKSRVISMKASIINSSKRMTRYSLFDSWAPIVIDKEGVFRKTLYERDWLKAIERGDCPEVRPGGVFKISIHSRVEKYANGIVWRISDGVGGDWIVKDIDPGSYKFCIRYFVSPKNPVNVLASERLGWDIGELWNGVGVSNWVDVELTESRK